MPITPKVKLSGYVFIEHPSTKYKPEGEYSCKADYTGTAAKKMKKTLDDFMKESLAKASNAKKEANPPYIISGTGDKMVLTVTFKQKAVIITKTGEKFEKEVKLFDAKANPIEEQIMLGAGSTVIISYSVYMWNVSATGAGITLQPEMIQVIDLVKREQNFTENPFSERDGYTAAKKDQSPFSPEDNTDDTAEDDEYDDDGDF